MKFGVPHSFGSYWWVIDAYLHNQDSDSSYCFSFGIRKLEDNKAIIASAAQAMINLERSPFYIFSMVQYVLRFESFYDKSLFYIFPRFTDFQGSICVEIWRTCGEF